MTTTFSPKTTTNSQGGFWTTPVGDFVKDLGGAVIDTTTQIAPVWIESLISKDRLDNLKQPTYQDTNNKSARNNLTTNAQRDPLDPGFSGSSGGVGNPSANFAAGLSATTILLIGGAVVLVLAIKD